MTAGTDASAQNLTLSTAARASVDLPCREDVGLSDAENSENSHGRRKRSASHMESPSSHHTSTLAVSNEVRYSSSIIARILYKR